MQIVEPIKAAAAIILTREVEPRVLLALRNQELRFMGGHHVFPGGRIDPDERVSKVRGASTPETAAAIHAAAREVFEETGLLVAEGPALGEEVLREARHQVMNGTLAFAAFLERHGLYLDAVRFEPAGRWVTPILAPIRFDTQYFLVRVDGVGRGELVRGEIVGLDWQTPVEARRRWRRGEIQLSPPVAYVLQQLAECKFPEVLNRLRDAGEHTGERPGKMEFRNGLYVLPLRSATLPPSTHTNCVVIGERALFVVDPGAHSDEERDWMDRQLARLEAYGARVAGVLLTHSHVDHVAAAEHLREKHGAPIGAHAATADQVGFRVDWLLEDGEIIEVVGDPPWRLRCLHTPGHDPGHLCFLEETSGTLIAGDMVANPGTIVVSLEHRGDMSAFLASLERLLHEEFTMLIPAHGMPPGDPKKKLREHLEHRLWRESKIRQALERGCSTMRDLLAASYDDVMPEVWPLAEYTLRAHLKRLRVEPPDGADRELLFGDQAGIPPL